MLMPWHNTGLAVWSSNPRQFLRGRPLERRAVVCGSLLFLDKGRWLLMRKRDSNLTPALSASKGSLSMAELLE
jgi:hypothetical protein